jgi:hypothetical protein
VQVSVGSARSSGSAQSTAASSPTAVGSAGDTAAAAAPGARTLHTTEPSDAASSAAVTATCRVSTGDERDPLVGTTAGRTSSTSGRAAHAPADHSPVRRCTGVRRLRRRPAPPRPSGRGSTST